MASESIVLKAGPPNWTRGISCPVLDGREPRVEAESAVASVSNRMDRGLLTVDMVNDVFTLVQVSLHDRCDNNARDAQSAARDALRSALIPVRPPSPMSLPFVHIQKGGALGLVTRLSSALQPREGETVAEMLKVRDIAKKGAPCDGGARDAVVSAAKHLSAMEKLVASQNNTSALLIAHNGLARLLKGRWPWLIGDVVDAPRLLSGLYSIYRDGLHQLKEALVEAAEKPNPRANSSSEAGDVQASPPPMVAEAEVTHLKKFGKLLATFGTRTACLLRHLGPECSPLERRKAFIILAKACAMVYPGVQAVRMLDSPDSEKWLGRDASSPASAESVVAIAVFPRAMEAFLSLIGSPPCRASEEAEARTKAMEQATGARGPGTHESDSASGYAYSRSGRVGEAAEETSESCRCYRNGGTGSAGAAAGEPTESAGHDPWEALEALRPRPVRLPPVGDPTRSPEDSLCDDMPDPLGAALLLCEALRSEERLSAAVVTRLGQCCGWVLEYLASLVPGWVEAASDLIGQDLEGNGISGEESTQKHLRVVAALCNDIAVALAVYFTHRALEGDIEEAQIRMLEGCACHPHPLCREVWCNALKAFLSRCDDEAQATIVQTFAGTALDSRVSPRCRRRIARALVVVGQQWKTAATPTHGGVAEDNDGDGVLRPVAVNRIRRLFLSQLATGAPARRTNHVGVGTGRILSEGGACALDLVRCVPWIMTTAAGDGDGGDEHGEEPGGMTLANASATYATMTIGVCLSPRNHATAANFAGTGGSIDEGNYKDGSRRSVQDDTLEGACVAAAKFLAAAQQWSGEVETSGDNRSGKAAQHLMQEATAEIGATLSRAVRAPRKLEAMELCESVCAAFMGLMAITDASGLPQLCAWVAEGARKEQVAGRGLLALAEGLSRMCRQPCAGTEVDVSNRELILTEGFSALFAAKSWPAITVAMQSLESIARHADPPTAKLLPRLVPPSRLAAFKARLARRMVTLGGKQPDELPVSIRSRGNVEWRILAVAAARTMATGGSSKRSKDGIDHDNHDSHRRVVLKEGGDLRAIVGLLSSTIVRIETNEGEPGTVSITLRS